MVSTKPSYPEETLLKMAATPAAPSDNIIFRASRVMGLFPFNPKLEEDRLLLAYSIAVTGAVTVIGIISMFEELPSGIGGFYHKLLVTTCTGGHMMIFPCALLKAFLRRRTVQEALREIREVQSRMDRIGLQPINSWTQIIPLIYISFWILSRFFLLYVTVEYTPSLSYWAYTLVQFGMLLVCGQYSYLVNNVGDVFHSAVDFLNEMKCSVSPLQHSGRVSEVVNAMNKLVTASTAINSIYSLQNLLIISMCFFGLSINLYYISIYVKWPIAQSYRNLFPQAYGALFISFIVWRMNQSSAETTEKSKEFNTALYKLMIEDKTKEIIRHGKLTLHIMMKSEVVFSACGFFNLDYSLVHSMLASATAYLIILIQFGESATP